MNTGATFDSTGLYRYSLWRSWDQGLPRLGFVMLNPNRADSDLDDPTIRRCLGFARSWGYGSLEVMNLFAYRTPDPKLLRRIHDPIGAENDRHLQGLTERVDRIILAWGNWGSLQNRSGVVITMLAECPLYCLGLTKLGYPRHPLYLKADMLPLPFESSPTYASSGDSCGLSLTRSVAAEFCSTSASAS